MARQPIIVKRKWTDAERLDAIAPLLDVPRTEELLAARAADVGVSSRTLFRWVADYEGRQPGGTKLRFDFPAAALFVTLKHFEGTSTRAIHELLVAEWPTLCPGKPCPSYSTLLAFVRSLPSASKEAQP
jgi:hypothetical protein